MAITTVTTKMAGAINYTVVTDTSADWPLVANSTYFYDKVDKLVHYKDATGTVLDVFTNASAIQGENLNVNLEPVIENTISDPSLILESDFNDSYLVPVGAIGVWLGQDNNIATWDGEQWQYYIPSSGDTTTVLTGVNAGVVYNFDGLVWQVLATTYTGATPFFIAGGNVDAGGNKTGTIARVAPLTLGSNSGSYGSSPLTVRGSGSLENLVTRWGMGLGTATTLNNWYRIATFSASNANRSYQVLFNIGGKSPNTFASVVLHINISKITGSGNAICRVVNISGPGYSSAVDANFRVDETNFEFRKYSQAALGPVTFRLYYKPTVLNTSVTATILNGAFGTTGASGIQWHNLYLGAAIEAPAFGGNISNYATYNYSGQRTNISAIVDPTVGDDANQQYTVGSLWYNTVTVKLWVCMNNTLGAAVWKLLTLTDNAGNIVIPGGLQFGPGYASGSITANTNNLLITNLGSSILVRFSSTGNFDITGIVVPDNTKSYLFNVFNINPQAPTPGSFSITFKNDNAGSTAQNRFLFGGDINVQPGEGVTLIYDPVDLRWRSPGKKHITKSCH